MRTQLAVRSRILHCRNVRGFKLMSVDRVPGVTTVSGAQPTQPLNQEAAMGAARLAALVKKQKRAADLAKEEAKLASAAPKATAAGPESSAASRLATFSEALNAKIDGQAHAKSVVARALRRRSLRLDDVERPLRMLFAGPSGVGKTVMATALCEALLVRAAAQLHPVRLTPLRRQDIHVCEHGRSGLLTCGGAYPALRGRFNLSEYSHVSKFNRLTGGDPNYVGYKEGGELTNFVRQAEERRAKRLTPGQSHTSCVVLFDEVDRAAEGLLTYLMNFLDQGQLTDGRGEMIDASRAVVLMTTNVGRDAIAAARAGHREEDEGAPERAEAVRAQLVEQIRLEVLREVCDGRWENLGRLGLVVPFLPLEARGKAAVVGRQLEEVARRAATAEPPARIGCSAALAAHITRQWDDDLGGRSTRDYIEERVVEALAEALDTAAPHEAEAEALELQLDLAQDALAPAAGATAQHARVVARPPRQGEEAPELGEAPRSDAEEDEEEEAWAAAWRWVSK